MQLEKAIFKLRVNDAVIKDLKLNEINDATNNEYLSMTLDNYDQQGYADFTMNYLVSSESRKILFYSLGLCVDSGYIFSRDAEGFGFVIGNIVDEFKRLGYNLNFTKFIEAIEASILETSDGSNVKLSERVPSFLSSGIKEQNASLYDESSSLTKYYFNKYKLTNKDAQDAIDANTPNVSTPSTGDDNLDKLVEIFNLVIAHFSGVQLVVNQKLRVLVGGMSGALMAGNDQPYIVEDTHVISDHYNCNLHPSYSMLTSFKKDKRAMDKWLPASTYYEVLNDQDMGKALKIFFNINNLAKASKKMNYKVIDLLSSDKDDIIKTIKKSDVKDFFKGQVLTNMIKKAKDILKIDNRDSRNFSTRVDSLKVLGSMKYRVSKILQVLSSKL